MAFRIDSRSCDAGNKLGLLTAARSDWHHGLADFHLGTGHQDPTHDAEYTTASDFRSARIYRSLSTCGRSPYTACYAMRSYADSVTARAAFCEDEVSRAWPHEDCPFASGSVVDAGFAVFAANEIRKHADEHCR